MLIDDRVRDSCIRRHGGPRIARLYDGTKSEILLPLWAGGPHCTFPLDLLRFPCVCDFSTSRLKSRAIAPSLRPVPADLGAAAEAAAARERNAIAVARSATLRARAPRRPAVGPVGIAVGVGVVVVVVVVDTVVSAAAVIKRRGALTVCPHLP